jgi:hypothetical protein
VGKKGVRAPREDKPSPAIERREQRGPGSEETEGGFAMNRKPSNPSDAAELRRRAKSRLKKKQKSQPLAQNTAHDTQRLVQELQIHQIELEIENSTGLTLSSTPRSTKRKSSSRWKNTLVVAQKGNSPC